MTNDPLTCEPFDVGEIRYAAEVCCDHDNAKMAMDPREVLALVDEIDRLRAIASRAEPAFQSAMDFRIRCTEELIIKPLRAERDAALKRLTLAEEVANAAEAYEVASLKKELPKAESARYAKALAMWRKVAFDSAERDGEEGKGVSP